MSIKKILARKDADPTEQLTEIAEIVAGAREAYGNKGAKIESPMCNTTNGQMEASIKENGLKTKWMDTENLDRMDTQLWGISMPTNMLDSENINENFYKNNYFLTTIISF